MYRKAKEGGFVGRVLSFGYRYKWVEVEKPRGPEMQADLEVVPEEANVARWIHDVFPTMNARRIAIALSSTLYI